MFNKRLILILLSVFLSLTLLTGSVSARQPSAAIGTGFTYQGRLTIEGAPAYGNYNFEFRLYDDSTGDVQQGSTVTIAGVPVTKGLFTVQLDFGPVFNGSMHYLEISVQPSGSSGAYTILSPRQALSAAPSAIYAASAPWSGLIGIPADFVDGVDKDTTYTAGDGLALDGTQFMGKGTSYQNVIIVAKSGGDFTSIQAALNSIPDDPNDHNVASAENPYLVYIAPGVYTERVTMKPYVDIQGAGEHATRITYTGSASANNGTVRGANNAELRFLTVENTGGSQYAIAIYNSSASPRLTHVTAITSGGEVIFYSDENFGVFNIGSSPIMTNMTISVSGDPINNGVGNYNSSPTMTNVTISAAGGGTNYGVYNNNSSATLTNVTVNTSGGSYNIGIKNTASGGSQTIQVSNSKITGSSNTISNSSGFTVHLSASQLSGGNILGGGGTVTCIGVYDEDYISPSYNACP